MIDGYDQWKTASPHDNEIDWSGHGVNCPGCKCDAPEEQGSDDLHVEFWCPDCGKTFKIPIEYLCNHVKDYIMEEDFFDIDDLTTD